MCLATHFGSASGSLEKKLLLLLQVLLMQCIIASRSVVFDQELMCCLQTVEQEGHHVCRTADAAKARRCFDQTRRSGGILPVPLLLRFSCVVTACQVVVT